MTLCNVLVEMNDVNNVIYNNFEIHEQLLNIICTVFPLGASKVDQKTIFSVKWLNFANFRDSWSENCILET